MIQKFVDKFMAKKIEFENILKAKHPEEYKDIVKAVISILHDENDYDDSPDPKHIHQINDGEYQGGTLIFVIGGMGNQPNNYWYIKIDYGSCRSCDTLERIRYLPNKEQIKGYMTLALHIVQGLKKMDERKKNQKDV